MEPLTQKLPVPVQASPATRDGALALLSLFIRVPEAALTLAAPGLDGLLDHLALEGSVMRHSSPCYGTVICVSESARGEASTYAHALWGADELRRFHSTAAEYFVAADDPCSAVYHHEQLGECDLAIELLKESWHRASFDVGHDAFLKTIQRLGRTQGNPDVELIAIQRLAATLPWPSVENPSLSLQLLNVVPESLGDLPLRSRIVITAAAITSLMTAGRLKPAIALGEAFVRANVDIVGVDPSTWETMPYLWNALAESYLTAGLSSKAAFYACKAEHLASGDGDWFPRFHAIELQAVAHGLNGELADAVRMSTRAREISDVACWELSLAHFPLLVSDILVASSSLDAEGLQRASATLKAAFPDSPLWATTAAACDAAVHLARNEHAEGLTVIRRTLNGTGEWGFLGIIRGFAIGIHADLLLASNAPGDALNALDDATSGPGHALCFDVQRSSAYILLGRPHDVLLATDECVAMGSEHCLRTLAPVLIRRAVALDLLSLCEVADQTFLEAFLLIRDSGSVIGLMNLPQSSVARLFARLVEQHPGYVADAQAIAAVASNLPGKPEASTDLSTFTTREVTLAIMLRSGADPVQIANELFLSTNTVKVHLRNIYRKLGVHTRAEALAKIESAGFQALAQRH